MEAVKLGKLYLIGPNIAEATALDKAPVGPPGCGRPYTQLFVCRVESN